jgi:hypothetical protein
MSSTLETIPPGTTLLEAVEGIFASRYLPKNARLEIWGAVRDVIIAAAPDAPPQTLGERAFLLQGHASHDGQRVVMFGVVSWSDNGIPRLMGGQLHDAASDGVSVLIIGDSVTERSGSDSSAPSPPTNRPSSTASSSAPPASRVESTPPREQGKASQPPAAGWSDAVRASERTQEGDSTGSQGFAGSVSGSLDSGGIPNFERGDTVVHPRYGRCAVVRAPKFHKLKLRRTTGAFFDLHLKVCRFEFAGDEDGHAVYRVQIVGRASSN